MIAVVVAAAWAGVVLGLVVVERHRAEASADLAALAGAVRAVEGERGACSAAGWVAGRMGVELTGCRVEGAVVAVDVLGRAPGVLGGFGRGRAAARAGPVEAGQAVVGGR
ncbi:hypothetical protein BJP25_01445 [Actinokineospora bangkokensis]|uniref:Putative Flp pilus-assembly TadG-like N-terminal domain-containing protein n=1 Tax=Actinokineospora bangkokensis TaxID=1193682 RepID=A0A1Q9LE13_9PSEU|nr:hypothetical protein BJP25_01445 [Actinokineospora bangkokensis]